VDRLVALGAKRNQVFLGVITKRTSRLDVVYVKMHGRAAMLAAPSVPP